VPLPAPTSRTLARRAVPSRVVPPAGSPARFVLRIVAFDEAAVAASVEEALAAAPLTSFGTTAIRPHVHDLSVCPPGATLLHVSLRDLAPEAILAHHNVVDDLHHVNRAQTSIHLASELAGNTDFVHGSLGEILLGRVEPPPHDGRVVIFSPFGLGTLDLAVADLVQRVAGGRGEGVRIPSFFPP